MQPFLKELSAGIIGCGLNSSRVVIALSGGADSVALLRGLRHLQQEHQLELRAAHLNHQLRANQSNEDADWVEALCNTLGIRLILDSRNVAEIAREQGRGLEETARKLRYKFLTETAIGESCTHVAVAHTANDQAETILHHILRGTGIAGLTGIPATRPLNDSINLARPMLAISRANVEDYLSHVGQDYRIDSSNEQQSFTRNRIRHSLLPSLKQEFNPQVEHALLRLGRQAADAQQTIEFVAAHLLEASQVDRNKTTCRLDCTQLSNQPAHLVRECISQLWQQQNWPRQRMGFAEWSRLADMVFAEPDTTSPHTLPGSIKVTRRANLLVLQQLK